MCELKFLTESECWLIDKGALIFHEKNKLLLGICLLDSFNIHTGNLSVYSLYSTMHQNTPLIPIGPALFRRSSAFGSLTEGFSLTKRLKELVEELSSNDSPFGNIHLALVAPTSPLHWSPLEVDNEEEVNWEYGGTMSPLLVSTIVAPGLVSVIPADQAIL